MLIRFIKWGEVELKALDKSSFAIEKGIHLDSYLQTFGFMILFGIIVSFGVHVTLKKINLIESLKSVE